VIGVLAPDRATRSQGGYERTARLYGTAEALRTTTGAVLPPHERADREQKLGALRESLGAAAFARAWAAGQRIPPAEAVALALQEGEALLPEQASGVALATRPAATATPEGAGPRRTRKERQAWALEYLRAAGSLTPRAYARALAVSVDTATIDLRELLARGLVQAEGTTRDRRYRLRGDAASRPFAESDITGPALESRFAEFGE
jgi:hypothetical protein